MMKKAGVASLLLAVTTSMALADSTSGTVVAYDRKAGVIVLDDKTIWSLEGSDAEAPADLEAGDKVLIEFESEGDDGITKIDGVTLTSE